jgi:hypothetical protein
MRQLLAALQDVWSSHISPLIAELVIAVLAAAIFAPADPSAASSTARPVGHRRMLANWAMRLQQCLDRVLA